MLGLIITFCSVCAAAYLIAKKYYPALSLLIVGLVTLTIVGLISPDPLITGKKATKLFAFDVVQMFTNLLQTRTAGLGMNIMVIGGFSYYMDKIGATRALVSVCVKPLSKIHAPYVVMAAGYVLGQMLNIFVPSAVGLALLLMVTLYPLLVSAGISRHSAAATIAITGACGLGPSSGNMILGAEISKMHVMEFFLNGQVLVAMFIIPAVAVVHFFIQQWFDKKDLASGKITQADFGLTSQTADNEAEKAPTFYALFPLLPVVLLFVFSPLMYKGVRLEVVTALLIALLVSFACDLLRRRNVKESFATMKSFFDGMGKLFSSTVTLIICAEVFAAGLTKSGGIATLIAWVGSMDAGAIAIFTVMFVIVAVAAMVTGSGNAPFFSFAPMIPDAAAGVGANVAMMLVPLQLVSGIGRSMSPVAGVCMAVAGMSGITPFELVRRTIPVMAVAMVVCYLRSLMLV
ncbi:MAG: C4-dicarboxylate transporter DcuC [Burkholderiaceae bacterium]|nr:C4-dicarboxylate transporter DcuC [Burkholderiaceae bacterium]